MTAQRVLDQVQSLAAIDALAAAPQRYAEALAAELPAAATLDALAARDAALADALAQVDALAARVMRVRLDHALASDTSLAPPTRRVFATTIVGYAHDLGLLAARVRDAAARSRGADADRVAEVVVAAARDTLALREAVRAGVLAVVVELAAAAAPEADRRARDRALDDTQRRRWSALRRELEAIAAEPARVASAPLASRLAAWPDQLDEPAPERALTREELLELD